MYITVATKIIAIGCAVLGAVGVYYTVFVSFQGAVLERAEAVGAHHFRGSATVDMDELGVIHVRDSRRLRRLRSACRYPGGSP
jgi:hypothetical protein